MCIEAAAQDMSGDPSTPPQNVRNPYQEIGSSTSKGREKDEEDLSQMLSGLSIAASAGFHPKVPRKPNAMKKAIFATVLVPASVVVNSVTGGMKAMTSGDTSKKKSKMKSCHCQLELVIPKFYTGCNIEDLVRQMSESLADISWSYQGPHSISLVPALAPRADLFQSNYLFCDKDLFSCHCRAFPTLSRPVPVPGGQYELIALCAPQKSLITALHTQELHDIEDFAGNCPEVLHALKDFFGWFASAWQSPFG